MKFWNIKSAPRDGTAILCVLNFGDGGKELHVMQSQDDPKWPWKFAYDVATSDAVAPGVATHWTRIRGLP